MNAPCTWTADVIARHLDGDVATASSDRRDGEWRSAEAMAEHLRDCAECQRQLQRSRRLDAALAEASGRATCDLEAAPRQLDALLARAIAAAAPPKVAPTPAVPTVPPIARRGALRPLLGASLVLLGFAAARLGGARTADGDANVRVAQPTAAAANDAPSAEPPLATPSAHAVADGAIAAVPAAVPTFGPLRARPTAAWTPDWPVPRSAASAQPLALLLADRTLADRLAWHDRVRRQLLGLGALPTTAAASAQLAEHARLHAAQALLDAGTAPAFAAFAQAAATLDDGAHEEDTIDRDALLDRVLRLARSRPAFGAWLRAQLANARADGLQSLAAFTVAARSGGRDLDSALRQLLRRTPALHPELVAALRMQTPRPGRAALLLDVGGDLVARGLAANDEVLARALFAGMPADVADELRAEFAQSRQLDRRTQSLLGLGALGSERGRALLLAVLRGNSLSEAFAAAFALAQLPREQLAELRDEAQRPGAWLLRAALCCAGVQGSERWLEPLDLSAAERRLLATGGFTFAQFPVFAALLRERGGANF